MIVYKPFSRFPQNRFAELLSISLSKISSPKYPWSLGTLPEDPRWGRRSKEEQTKGFTFKEMSVH